MTLFILILVVSVLLLVTVTLIIIVKLREKVPLIRAIKRNHTQEAMVLIRQGADINVRNDLQETPLIHASIAGNGEIARVLVASGADVNAQSSPFRRSALLEAAVKGHADIVRLLIKAGADVSVKDWDENTALMQAAISGSNQAVDDLLAAGADVNARNKEGKTALFSAILLKNTDVARTLIKAGAGVNRIDDRGESALHWLLGTQQYETADAFFDDLMSGGLDIHAKDRGGSQLLTSAVVAALRERAKDKHPLLNIVRNLVTAGADVETALGIAYMHKADDQNVDPMGFFNRHITDIIDILTSKSTQGIEETRQG